MTECNGLPKQFAEGGVPAPMDGAVPVGHACHTHHANPHPLFTRRQQLCPFDSQGNGAQRGDVTCLKTHSCVLQSQDLDSGLCHWKSHAPNPYPTHARTHPLFVPVFEGQQAYGWEVGQNLHAQQATQWHTHKWALSVWVVLRVNGLRAGREPAQGHR